MAGSINKVILIGNLGKDPEVKYFENGGTVANFPLATTETYKNKETGERVSLPTDWHNISIRKTGLAKIAETYLKKGQLLYVEGKLRTRSYEKNGEKKYITEVVADDFTMLGGKRDEESLQYKSPESSTVEEPEQTLDNDVEQDSADVTDDLPF